jgi:ATP synthase in type III secretion protein N
MTLDLTRLSKSLQSIDLVRVEGRVQSVVGLSIRTTLPGARLGELVEIGRADRSPLLAEVVGFSENIATLLPFGPTEGVGPDDVVRLIGHPLRITFGDSLLGRVLDGLGQPIDNGPALTGSPWDVMRPTPKPLTRPRIVRPLSLGIRALDGFVTVGEGQRIGVFSGSGVGKSSLLGQIARQADADVFVVCLVGERGRELVEFLEDNLGEQGLKRSVVVCATSDSAPLIRYKCPFVATSIAEGFRDQGKRVVLLLDSITRFARSAREVGLAAGEVPVRRGYPPSVFAVLPTLLERSGTSEKGSITAFYSVLVESDDLDEPISDEVRGILDGHIVLSRELSHRGRFPAVDVLSSLSRLMNSIVDKNHYEAAQKVRHHLAVYEAKRDLVLLGAYKKGSDTNLDAALQRIERIEAFLKQDSFTRTDINDTVERLKALV